MLQYISMAREKNAALITKLPAARRLIALLLGVLFAIVLAEAALRISGGVLQFTQERRNRISLSRGGYRIMCLGESTTDAGAYAWPAQLERLLGERYPTVSFSVINKAIAGTDTSQIINNLKRNLDEIRPNLVITMMGINDGFIRYYEGISNAESLLFRHSRLYKLYKWITLLQKMPPPRNEVKPDPQSVHTEPRSPYYDFAICSDNCTPTPESEGLLRTRIKRNPDDVYALYILGRYWTHATDHPDLAEKGERLLLRAAQLDPKNSFVLNALGMRLSDKHSKRAIRMLEKAVELNPSKENWYRLGSVYKSYNMPDKAESALLKALDFNVSDDCRDDALFALSWFYIKTRRFTAAEKLLREARKFHPENERISGALASLYRESGRPFLARQYDAGLTVTRAMFTEITRANFKKLKQILESRGIRLAVMQYPMCALAPLRGILGNSGDVIFIDNERNFRSAVDSKGYVFYFHDMFAGNFGHCTPEGHKLIAHNAADALSGYFTRLPPK
ncbi:MAG TPA: hypothetical protein DCG50_04220 [Elusimicrobia bacterium]|nr:hypothetical protein [Elusimicrobiota bacterium]